MSLSPTLSVIIPTYNRGPLLKETLESVLRQTFSDYEIVVVDDGSTDCTERVIEQLKVDWPERQGRIHYFFQKNQGKSVALNRGIAEAKGEWLAFLDSDDLWLPNKIEKQFQVLQRFAPESEACFTDANFINNTKFEGTAFERMRKRFKSAEGLISDPKDVIIAFYSYMQTIIVHSRVMKRVGDFDPAFWTGQDRDFLFRLFLETKLSYVNAPLVLIDRTPKRAVGLSEKRLSSDYYKNADLRRRMVEKWLHLVITRGEEGEGIIESHLQREELEGVLRSELRSIWSIIGNCHLANTEYEKARKAFWQAWHAKADAAIGMKWSITCLAPHIARRIVMHRRGHIYSQAWQEERLAMGAGTE